MIQCVGYEEVGGYCSRVCCSQAVKNALRLKEEAGCEVYVLYREMRTYGMDEEYYRRAREEGVVFIRYDEGRFPDARREGGEIKVVVFDSILGEEIEIGADLLVLSVGVVPREGSEELSKVLKVPLDEDGFFLEGHVKLRPLEFSTEGIFLCGMAQYPKLLRESVYQAEGAVSRACTILSKDKIETTPIIAEVDEERCSGCSECILTCGFGAIEVIERRAKVNPAICKGCGTCAAACLAKAIRMRHFTDEELVAQVVSIFEEAP
jgi:heterodisulfide reductase subunit A